MRLEPLYYVVWEYQRGWRVYVTEETLFNYSSVEGRVEGRLTGAFHGSNHGWRRDDRTFLPDVQGVIITEDGTTVGVDIQGYGSPYPPDRKRVVVAIRHFSEDETWRFLNDTISVGFGENRVVEDGTVLAMIEVFEAVWEPLHARIAKRPAL